FIIFCSIVNTSLILNNYKYSEYEAKILFDKAKKMVLKKQLEFENAQNNLLIAQTELIKAAKLIKSTSTKSLYRTDSAESSIACSTCKIFAYGARLGLFAANTTISGIYLEECNTSCMLFSKHIWDHTLCSMATSNCRNNTKTNILLQNKKLPCVFCKDGLTLMKSISQPLIDLLGIFKKGCGTRKTCINYFDNVLYNLERFISDVLVTDGIDEICKEILKCIID
ncbi:hypothetical protein Mgra_00002855, partial [Meloidogyne graminicola]